MPTPGDSPSTARPPGVDRDRGFGAGIAVGAVMFAALQALLLACYQLATRGEGTFLGPLRFAPFTQLLYVVPTLLLFVNRGCPRMALGTAAFAGAVALAGAAYAVAG